MWNLLISFGYEIFLTFVILFSLLYSYLIKSSWDESSFSLRSYCSELALFFAVILLLMLILFSNGELAYHLYEGPKRSFYANQDFHTTPFSLFCKIFAILITSSCLFLASHTTIKYCNFNRIEYPFFFLTALLAVLLLISSYHLIYIYLSLELLNFSLYLIVGAKVFSSLSNEASQRYFVYSSYASALLLLGIALLYGLFGSINLQELSFLASESLISFNQKMLLSLSLLCIYAGLLFKLSIFPFHFWVPEVYEGSPLSSILFLATVPKIAFVHLFLKITFSLTLVIPFFLTLLQLLSLLSIAYGTIAGLYEYRLKRFFAYSTISNMGFVLLSLSLANLPGITAGMLYLIIYILTTIAFFGLLMLFSTQNNNGKQNPYLEPLEIKEIFSLQSYKQHPAYTFGFTVLILSLAGIPPLAGFFIKFYLLQACLLSGNILLAFLIFLLSVLALGFYLRLLRVLYVTPLRLTFQKNPLRNVFFSLQPLPFSILLPLLLIVFLLITYSLFFNNLLIFFLTTLVINSFPF